MDVEKLFGVYGGVILSFLAFGRIVGVQWTSNIMKAIHFFQQENPEGWQGRLPVTATSSIATGTHSGRMALRSASCTSPHFLLTHTRGSWGNVVTTRLASHCSVLSWRNCELLCVILFIRFIFQVLWITMPLLSFDISSWPRSPRSLKAQTAQTVTLPGVSPRSRVFSIVQLYCTWSSGFPCRFCS